MRLPFQRWPGHALSLPLGLALSLQAPLAAALTRPYRSRRAVARPIVARVAVALPTRPSHVATARGDATPFPHGQTLSTTTTAPPRPARRPAQKRRGDRLAQDLGDAVRGLAPAPAGSWSPAPVVGGALAPRLPR